WKVTVALRVVQPVADHELVRDLEPGIGDLDVRLHRVRLAQHCGDRHRSRVARLQVAHQPRQRETGVDDVLNDQHVPAAYVRVQVLQNAHNAGGLGPRAVGGDGHPVHLDGQVHGTGEVRHHHHRPLQHADKEQFTTGVI